MSDYYVFGMAMPGRSFNSEAYRFGYQGSEKDNEISGAGNSYTTFFRQLDPRLGRWFSPDPVFQPWQSPYTSMDNNPINLTDVMGDETGEPEEKMKKTDENGDLTDEDLVVTLDEVKIIVTVPEVKTVPESSTVSTDSSTDSDSSQDTDKAEPSSNGPSILEAALIANHVYEADSWYSKTDEQINEGLIGGWEVSDNQMDDYINDDTGFKSALYERKNNDGSKDYVYATAGTDDLHDVGTDLNQALAGMEGDPQYIQSTNIAFDLVFGPYFDKNLTFVGHSLGGGLATANSLATGYNAIVFNPAGVSEHHRQILHLHFTNADIISMIVEGEVVDWSNKVLNIPYEGKVYNVPAVGDLNSLKKHMMGAMIEALINAGYGQ